MALINTDGSVTTIYLDRLEHLRQGLSSGTISVTDSYHYQEAQRRKRAREVLAKLSRKDRWAYTTESDGVKGYGLLGELKDRPDAIIYYLDDDRLMGEPVSRFTSNQERQVPNYLFTVSYPFDQFGLMAAVAAYNDGSSEEHLLTSLTEGMLAAIDAVAKNFSIGKIETQLYGAIPLSDFCDDDIVDAVNRTVNVIPFLVTQLPHERMVAVTLRTMSNQFGLFKGWEPHHLEALTDDQLLEITTNYLHWHTIDFPESMLERVKRAAANSPHASYRAVSDGKLAYLVTDRPSHICVPKPYGCSWHNQSMTGIQPGQTVVLTNHFAGQFKKYPFPEVIVSLEDGSHSVASRTGSTTAISDLHLIKNLLEANPETLLLDLLVTADTKPRFIESVKRNFTESVELLRTSSLTEFDEDHGVWKELMGLIDNLRLVHVEHDPDFDFKRSSPADELPF